MKRILAGITGLILSAATLAATLSPVQLLNPSGSTAGQAIVSTGPSSAPAWAAVSAGSLAPIAANTVLGNFTGSSTVPAAFAVPSCSTANSALKYTSGTGLSCGTTFALTSGNLSQFASTTSAQLLGVLSDETGTGSAVFSASPALTGTPTAPTAAAGTSTTQIATTAFARAEFAAPPAIGNTTPGTGAFTTLSSTGTFTPSQTNGIVGTTTNNNANAGSVGEYQTATTTATSATTGVALNATSVSLTAGDWDVECLLQTNPAGTTNTTSVNVGISTTSATFQNITAGFVNATVLNYSVNQAGSQIDISSPRTRLSIASTTTAYCVAQVAFNTSTMTVSGFIRARRIR